MTKSKRPAVAVHETHVVKNCAPGFFYDGEGKFHGCAPERLAASGLAVLLRANLTKRKAAKVIRTAEEKSFEDRHSVAATPLAYRRNLAVEEENKVFGQMKILRSFQIQAIDLSVASKKAAGDSRRKGDALPTARKQRIVARIKDKTAKDFAFDKCAFFFLDE